MIQIIFFECFGFALLKAGKDSNMLKFDKADADNKKHASHDVRHLQAGSLLGRPLFCWNQAEWLAESKASVQNFDIIDYTTETLVHTECKIQNELALKQLDKIPLQTTIGVKNFLRNTYHKLCDELNLELEPPCPKWDTAFWPIEVWKGVGYFFYTQDLYSGDFQRAKSYHLWTR